MKNIFLNMPEDISLGDIDEFANAFQDQLNPDELAKFSVRDKILILQIPCDLK